jgi:uncharacterized membrane protein
MDGSEPTERNDMTATYPADTASDPGASNPLVRATLALEGATALDALTRLVAPAARALVRSPERRDLLQGRWLGHAVHPVLVMVPVGAWSSVSILDLVGGPAARPAARTLTGVGILASVPAAVTGLAEWADANQRDRRTATVHALSNSIGLAFYVRSWRARRKGQHARGAALAVAGSAAVGVGGYLGGHLTMVRKVGSHHPAYVGT